MNRLVAILALCAACASSRSATVALRAETAVEAKATVETRVQEDRGPMTTVVEEYAPAANGPPARATDSPLAGRLRMPAGGAKPILTRRTTITQAPVHVATETHAVTAERVTAVAAVAATAQSATRPAIGCGFSLGLLAIPLAALGAALLWRFRPWIH